MGDKPSLLKASSSPWGAWYLANPRVEYRLTKRRNIFLCYWKENHNNWLSRNLVFNSKGGNHEAFWTALFVSIQ